MGRPIQKKWLGLPRQISVSGIKFSDGAIFTNGYIIKQTGSRAYLIQDEGKTHNPEILFMVNASSTGALLPGQCYILASVGGFDLPCEKITQYRLSTYEANGTIGNYSWAPNGQAILIDTGGDTPLPGGLTLFIQSIDNDPEMFYVGTDENFPTGTAAYIDWGDGSPEQQVVTWTDQYHRYTIPGIYTVTLVDKDSGEDPFASGTIELDTSGTYDSGGESPFVPDFSPRFQLSTFFIDVPIQFNDLTVLYDEPVTSWLWDFGDGSTSTEQNPIHTYDTVDEYTVTLAVNGGSPVSSIPFSLIEKPITAVTQMFGDSLNGTSTINNRTASMPWVGHFEQWHLETAGSQDIACNNGIAVVSSATPSDHVGYNLNLIGGGRSNTGNPVDIVYRSTITLSSDGTADRTITIGNNSNQLVLAWLAYSGPNKLFLSFVGTGPSQTASVEFEDGVDIDIELGYSNTNGMRWFTFGGYTLISTDMNPIGTGINEMTFRLSNHDTFSVPFIGVPA